MNINIMKITEELQAKIIDDIRYKLLSHFKVDNFSVVIAWFKVEELYKCFYCDNLHNLSNKLVENNLDNIILKLKEINCMENVESVVEE